MKRLDMINKPIGGQWFNKLYFSGNHVPWTLFSSMRTLNESSFMELTRNRYTFILEMDFEPYLYKEKIMQL